MILLKKGPEDLRSLALVRLINGMQGLGWVVVGRGGVGRAG